MMEGRNVIRILAQMIGIFAQRGKVSLQVVLGEVLQLII